MKEQDDKLTLQETERLCQMYLDCTLSVFEETELQYVLTMVDHHSPLIDDVRGMMGIKLNNAQKGSPGIGNVGKRWFHGRTLYLGIAASIAILLGVGISLFHDSYIGDGTGHGLYIAYADGHRLSDEAARSQVEADIKTADDFIKEMAELEEREKRMIENFTDLNNFE